MKRWMVWVLCAGLMGVTGCDFLEKGNTPEAVGKAYISDMFKDIHCDLAGLTYTVAALDEETAEVTIFGTVQVEETLALVKRDGQWVMAGPTAKPVIEPAAETAKHP
jgi:hypothetical protein